MDTPSQKDPYSLTEVEIMAMSEEELQKLPNSVLAQDPAMKEFYRQVEQDASKS